MDRQTKELCTIIALHIYAAGDANDLWEEGWLGNDQEQETYRLCYQMHSDFIDNLSTRLEDIIADAI